MYTMHGAFLLYLWGSCAYTCSTVAVGSRWPSAASVKDAGSLGWSVLPVKMTPQSQDYTKNTTGHTGALLCYTRTSIPWAGPSGSRSWPRQQLVGHDPTNVSFYWRVLTIFCLVLGRRILYTHNIILIMIASLYKKITTSLYNNYWFVCTISMDRDMCVKLMNIPIKEYHSLTPSPPTLRCSYGLSGRLQNEVPPRD